MAPFWEPFRSDALSLLAPFSRPFPKVDFLMHFGRPLAHFGLPFGSLWLPFGSLLAPFGSLWLTFGSLWLPLAHIFAPFGSLFAPFGSLLLHFLTLGVSWRRFWSLSDIFNENLMKNHVFLCFSLNFLLFTYPLPQSTCKLIEGTLLLHSARFSHTSILAGPGRIIAARN